MKEYAMLLMKISQTALNWLKAHIRGMDKEFAAFYRKPA